MVKGEANKQHSSTNHPLYIQMITEAISTLKDRTGSSQPAIAKVVQEKYPNRLPRNFKKILSIQLKNFAKSGKLVKVKNSYKVSSTADKTVKGEEKEKEKQKKTAPASEKTNKASTPKKAAKKVLEKAAKTKRLSQVKTPEALKKKSSKRDPTPAKRKAPAPAKSEKSTRPAKKAKN